MDLININGVRLEVKHIAVNPASDSGHHDQSE